MESSIMPNSDYIVKKGVLQRYSTKERNWVKKFYVLYRTSDRNAARLDWYDDENVFRTNPSIRKTLFIEEIKLLERLAHDNSEARRKYGDFGKHALLISKHRSGDDVTLVRANNTSTINEWMKEINGLLETARTQSLRSRIAINNSAPASSLYQPHAMSHAVSFDVEVDDTAAANVCSLYGQYRLVLTSEHVTLIDSSDSPVLSWLYSHVRRYGFSGETFTLEGGHKAGQAAGLFIFKSCRGADIRSAIEAKMEAIKEAKKSGQEYAYIGFGELSGLGGSSSSCNSSNSPPSSPTVVQPVVGPQLHKPPPNPKNITSQPGKADRNNAKNPKPSPLPKPGHDVSPAAEPSGGPVKMSEVNRMLRQAAAPATATAVNDTNEYSEINLVRAAGARAQSTASDAGRPDAAVDQPHNVYGPLLMQKQRSQDPDPTYAEIGVQ